MRYATVEMAVDASERTLREHDFDCDRVSAMQARAEARHREATCEDCAHCQVPPARTMEPLVRYVTRTVATLYDKKEDVLRSDESLEYDFSRACANARLDCCYCLADEVMDFVSAEDSAADCESFLGR